MHGRLVAIVGPTATGKSALGLDLAEEMGGEIINGDALQIYRGFDLGTAKPTLEEQNRVPHHLIDILDPRQRYSAGEFNRLARVAIEEIRSRGKLPIVVGGSGLYIRALIEGIAPIPTSDPAIRERLRERLEKEGLELLRKELEQRDPETWSRLLAGDSQRILRALEIFEVTGVTQSEWIAMNPFGASPLSAVQIGLTLPRVVLYDRIEKRAARMVELGWLDEVRSLMASGLTVDSPAFQAIGYRQLASHLQGLCSLEEALEETIRATRRFAKRQETWFRKGASVIWFDALRLEDEDRRIRDLLRRETS